MYRPQGIVASLVTNFTPSGALDRKGIVTTVDLSLIHISEPTRPY